MLDVQLDPVWFPLERFSEFNFGGPVMCVQTEGPARVTAQDGRLLLHEMEAVRGCLRQAQLACEIRTILGAIHEITTRSTCRFRGINLIGSMVEPIREMFGYPDIRFSLADPETPNQLRGTIDDVGLILHESGNLGPIHGVTMRGPLTEHRKREHSALIAEMARGRGGRDGSNLAEIRPDRQDSQRDLDD